MKRVSSQKNNISSNSDRPTYRKNSDIDQKLKQIFTPAKSKILSAILKKSSEGNSKPRHRQVKSFQTQPDKYPLSSPSKSRFETSYIPCQTVDIRNIKSDIEKSEKQRLKIALAEQRLMTEDWIRAQKQIKEILSKETKDHELSLTRQYSQFNQTLKKEKAYQEKTERKEKQKDYLEFIQAKKIIAEKKKQKEAEYAHSKRRNSLSVQQQINEKREQQILEREEKRKAYLETLEVSKLIQNQEKCREQKEMLYEQTSKIIGMREISLRFNESQQLSYDKTSILFTN
jgi:hypothetical protein